MSDYSYNFSIDGQAYELRLEQDEHTKRYHVSGQLSALKALKLQPEHSLSMADLHERFRACKATNVVCENKVRAVALQILAPNKIATHLAKIENGIAIFDPKCSQATRVVTLKELMHEYGIPGASIAIFDHEATCHKGYGTLQNENLLVQAASISKMVCALTVLSLVKDNKLSLESDACELLKGYWQPDKKLDEAHKMTILHLLSHTAGTSIHGFDGHEPGTTRTTDEIIKDVKLDHLPDKEHFSYSGGGTMLLQKIVEIVCKKPFADVVKEQVFEPLAMQKSSYNPEEEKIAIGHAPDGKSIRFAYPEHAAAGLYSTPDDLIKVVMAIQKAYNGEDSRIITKDLAEKMLTPQTPGRPNGLGMWVDRLQNSVVFHHPGENSGFRCVLIANSEKQGACIMTDSDNGKTLWKDMLRAISKECNWPDKDSLLMCRPLCTPDEVKAVKEDEWSSKYAGTYQCVDKENGMVETIKVTSNFLQKRGVKHHYEVIHLGEPESIFREFTPGPPAAFHFTKDVQSGNPVLYIFDKYFQRM